MSSRNTIRRLFIIKQKEFIMIVYKITNTINGKVYIGLTTLTLEYRWKRHLTEGRNPKNKKHLYLAMRKYGEEAFKPEIIAETDNFETLGKMERYYIRSYDSTNPDKGYNLTRGGEKNQHDGNPQSKLNVEDVIFIRLKYAECKMSVKECWEKYFSFMSYSGFQKVWDGFSWKGIMDEVYTLENKNFHRTQVALRGEKNGNSKYTDEEVMEIRRYYVNHTLKETYDRYNKYNESMDNSFRNLIDESYLHLPRYSKIRKRWELKGKPIVYNVNNPVSTISESGE